jgi:N-acetylmuramoyl-L-alanine amidase
MISNEAKVEIFFAFITVNCKNHVSLQRYLSCCQCRISAFRDVRMDKTRLNTHFVNSATMSFSFHRLYIIIVCLFALLLAPSLVSAQSRKVKVVLDAGHGGKDPGAIGSSASNREKDIALAITLEVGRMLKANNPLIEPVYTRSTDVFVELGRRADIANDIKAALFVSIHVNALPKGRNSTTGVQAYTLTLEKLDVNLEVEKRENSVIALEGEAAKKYNYSNNAESDIMFELMQDRDMQESVDFARLAQTEMVNYAGRVDMGVLQANLAVLRLTYMPSALLEVGFISTPSEEAFLMSDEGRIKMAHAIYNAIVKYFKRI